MIAERRPDGRPPRVRWLDAVQRSDLPPTQRLTALVVGLAARELLVSISHGQVAERTGLGRTATATAMRGLVRAEWLLVLLAPRQNYSAKYQLSVPPGVPLSGSPGDTLSEPRGPRNDARGSGNDTRGPRGVPSHQSTSPPSMGPAPVEQSPGEVLAEVVVVGLPTTIGQAVTWSTLVHVCSRLAAGGMTPERLAELVRRRSWSGAGPGLLVEVLTGWAERPPPVEARPSAPACDVCAGSGWSGEDDDGRPVRCQCRRPLRAVTA